MEFFAETGTEQEVYYKIWDVEKDFKSSLKPKVSKGLILVNRLRLRSKPGLSGDIITHVNQFDQVRILDFDTKYEKIGNDINHWWKIETETGEAGWIFAQYIGAPYVYRDPGQYAYMTHKVIVENDMPNSKQEITGKKFQELCLAGTKGIQTLTDSDLVAGAPGFTVEKISVQKFSNTGTFYILHGQGFYYDWGKCGAPYTPYTENWLKTTDKGIIQVFSGVIENAQGGKGGPVVYTYGKVTPISTSDILTKLYYQVYDFAPETIGASVNAAFKSNALTDPEKKLLNTYCRKSPSNWLTEENLRALYNYTKNTPEHDLLKDIKYTSNEDSIGHHEIPEDLDPGIKERINNLLEELKIEPGYHVTKEITPEDRSKIIILLDRLKVFEIKKEYYTWNNSTFTKE